MHKVNGPRSQWDSGARSLFGSGRGVRAVAEKVALFSGGGGQQHVAVAHKLKAVRVHQPLGAAEPKLGDAKTELAAHVGAQSRQIVADNDQDAAALHP